MLVAEVSLRLRLHLPPPHDCFDTSFVSIKKSRFLGFRVVNLHVAIKKCIFFDRRTKLFKLEIQVSAIVRRGLGLPRRDE